MMDKRMIELAKAKWEAKEICHTAGECNRCPLCFPDGRCLCVDKNALAEAEKMCGADEESHGNPKIAEIMAAKGTLQKHCGIYDDCVGCEFEDEHGCTIGYPATWRYKYVEIYKDMEICKDTKEETPAPSFTPAEKRKRVLDEAIDAVCRDRCEMYGEVEDNFGVIAELWNAYLKAGMPEGACAVDLGARQVAEMMILFKVGRVATAMEDHLDTYVDIAGYAACAGGMCTDA